MRFTLIGSIAFDLYTPHGRPHTQLEALIDLVQESRKYGAVRANRHKQSFLAGRWHWSESKVSRQLCKWVQEGLIERNSGYIVIKQVLSPEAERKVQGNLQATTTVEQQTKSVRVHDTDEEIPF